MTRFLSSLVPAVPALALFLLAQGLGADQAIAQRLKQGAESVVPANPLPTADSPTATPPASSIPNPASGAPSDDASESPIELPAPPPLVSPEAVERADITTYVDDAMSFDYPSRWQVSAGDQEGSVQVVSTPAAEADLVDTQIFRLAADPGAVVNANLDSFREEGSAVSRYQTVAVDGQDALTIWLTDRPDDLGSAIATFVGYGNAETMLLFSRYSADTASAEEDILLLHSSFSNLAAANPSADAADDAVPGASEDAADESMLDEVVAE